MIDKLLIDRIKAYLQKEFLFDQDRLSHINYVTKEALDLGEIFGVDKDKITVASLLHDATKKLNFKDNFTLASKVFPGEFLKTVPKPCLHAYSSCALAKEIFGVTNQDILNAISYHCSGRKEMSMLEKIIFVADYTEESRDFKDERIRQIAREDLDRATYLVMKKTEDYLKRNNREISPLTIEAIKAYESQKEEFND